MEVRSLSQYSAIVRVAGRRRIESLAGFRVTRFRQGDHLAIATGMLTMNDSADPTGRGLATVSIHDLLRFERLLSDMSATFMNVPAQDVDRAIDESLARIVETLRIDRSTLSRVYPLTGEAAVTHSFAVDGVDPVEASRTPVPERSPWALGMAMANRPVVFERLDDLPPEACVDKENYRRLGLKSQVMMPIVVGGQLYGGLSFGCVRAERNWPEPLLSRMRLLADIFGSALARKRAREELDNAIGFERLASAILASLVLAKPREEHRAISSGLRQIGEFVGAEQVALWLRFGNEPSTVATQHWQAEGFESALGSTEMLEFPWVKAQVAAGRTVRLARIDELSPDAGPERAALSALGVRSLLVVPISVSGRIGGALSIASVQREHEWPDVLTPGVSLLAEVFGSLHAREAAERRKVAAEIEASHWRERLAHLVRVHTAGEMSVALAHEITQPLGAIENYALAARRRACENAPDMGRVVDLLDKIIGQATRAGNVVTRMRSMTQRHELDPGPIDVERAVRECVDMVKMDCDLRNIRIHLKPAHPSLPIVVVDEIHLQQVVLNLLRNAMEAIACAPPDGAREITVSLGLNEHDEVLVGIADRGTGIAEGDLERVFESFYTTKSGGLGVGLAICRKLIEVHGGVLWAAHNPGGGAVFRFTLPVAAPGD
jgi:signal transduction histidine kinase